MRTEPATLNGPQRGSPVIRIPRETLFRTSPIPLYHRLGEQLRQLIDRGVFSPDERLPSEQEIADHLYVSRPTVRHALNSLERDRLVRREQGRGTFVNPVVDRGPLNASSDQPGPRRLRQWLHPNGQ